MKTVTTDFTEGGWAAQAGRCDGMCFKPRIARVKRVHDDGTLDLVLYSYDGARIGRESPAMGGPTHFEPCCSPESWEPIEKPDFELTGSDRYTYGFLLKWKRPHPEFDQAAV